MWCWSGLFEVRRGYVRLKDGMWGWRGLCEVRRSYVRLEGGTCEVEGCYVRLEGKYEVGKGYVGGGLWTFVGGLWAVGEKLCGTVGGYGGGCVSVSIMRGVISTVTL